MFFINTITIENFKSYVGVHTFEFPTEPGLYFITGNNETDPQLGSNGAGKSTLLDAICWGLYGVTSRGLRASDIISWGQKSASVSITLTVRDSAFTVARTQSPNSLTIEYSDGKGKPLEQDELNKELRLSLKSFLYSVMFSQFGETFFDLSPSKKIELFSEIMDLDFWLDKSKQAAELVGQISMEITGLESDIKNNIIQTERLTQEIESLNAKSIGFERDKMVTINKFEKQKEYCGEELTRLAAELGLAQSKLKKVESTNKDSGDQRKRLEKSKDTYAVRREELTKEYTILCEKITAAEKSLTNLASLKGSCPTCKQEVTRQTIDLGKSYTTATLKKLEEERVKVKSDFEATKAFQLKAQKSIEKLDDEEAARKSDIELARKAVSKIEGEIKTQEAYRERLDAVIEIEYTRENSFSDLIKHQKDQLHRTSVNIEKTKKELEALMSDREAATFWVAGFKRIRLFVLEGALSSFELEVNNSLTGLGLEDWKIEFDVERENKSGGLTKGFTVLISNQSQEGLTKWEHWSGGEGQRLKMSGGFGLANLIMAQAGLSNGIEFYDEPTKHLANSSDLAEALHERAITEGKVIFLIDHNTIQFGEFAQVYQVIKTKAGSSLESC